MERRVKERLVGASIVVVLIVLIVPELLSGPKPAPPPLATPTESVRNVTVDLATSKAPERTDVDAPASPTAAVPTTTPAATPTAGVQTPALATAPTVQSAPALQTAASEASNAAAISRADWSVQLGSFASVANSDKLLHQLKAKGFPVYTSSTGSGRALRVRVRIGPLPDRSAAEHTVAKLRSLGHESSVVTPGH